MAFKEILVQLGNHPNFEARLQIAASIAERNEAQLTAIYRFELPTIEASWPSIAVPLASAELTLHEQTYEKDRDAAFIDAERSEARFHAAIKRASVRGSWEISPRTHKEYALFVAKRARYADLAIVGQPNPDHPGATANLPETVMLGCGRPALIIPYNAQPLFVGVNVLIAWNGTREAARAVGDALPILRSATIVTLVTIDKIEVADDNDDGSAQRLLDYLRRHEVRAEISHLTSDGIAAGGLLLSRAAEIGCDLIVMGGYGHSWTRELMLGGVTRFMLRHMTLPVLISH